MKRTSKASFSTTLVLAIMLLACLLVHTLGTVGAWFTAGGTNIKIQVNIAGMGVYVYQTIENADGSKETIEIDPEDAEKQAYITLSGEISPAASGELDDSDKTIPLNMSVGTNDPSGIYLRFKFEVYALGQTDTLLKTKDIGVVAPESSANGFVYQDPNDSTKVGYYNYQNTSGVQQKFTPNKDSSGNVDITTITLFTGFQIQASEFESKQLNGQTIKIVLKVECSDTAF